MTGLPRLSDLSDWSDQSDKVRGKAFKGRKNAEQGKAEGKR